jgi:hypothetical protein
MPLKIKSHDQLEKLLDSISQNAVDANIYFTLFKDINAAIPEYSREYAQSGTFWYLTIQAIKEAYLIRLCKVYDSHAESLNFSNLLLLIKANSRYFIDGSFRERLSSNPFVESLAKADRMPDPAQLDRDIVFSSRENPIVAKLLLWRHNSYAHLGGKVALGNVSVLRDNPLSAEEIEELLNRAYEMANRYLNLFKATTWSRTIVGHQDFKSIFSFIRTALESHDAKLEAERALWEKPINDAT